MKKNINSFLSLLLAVIFSIISNVSLYADTTSIKYIAGGTYARIQVKGKAQYNNKSRTGSMGVSFKVIYKTDNTWDYYVICPTYIFSPGASLTPKTSKYAINRIFNSVKAGAGAILEEAFPHSDEGRKFSVTIQTVPIINIENQLGSLQIKQYYSWNANESKWKGTFFTKETLSDEPFNAVTYKPAYIIKVPKGTQNAFLCSVYGELYVDNSKSKDTYYCKDHVLIYNMVNIGIEKGKIKFYQKVNNFLINPKEAIVSGGY